VSEEERKKLLEDVAVKLYYNLHSAENENIISTLLTASLNESPAFVEMFLQKVGRLGNYEASNFYAEANVSIPVKSMMSKVERGKAIHRRWHPDISLLDYSSQKELDAIKDSGAKKQDLASAWGKVRVIFVEVKHTDLSQKDSEKYNKYNECISGQCDKNRVKFVIISSHTKLGLIKLKLEDENWSGLKGWKHICLSEIYEILTKIRKIKTDTMLRVFESYLVLILGPAQVGYNQIFERYWRDVIKDKTDPKKDQKENKLRQALKKEVVKYIKDLAWMNGYFSGKRWIKDNEIDRLKAIELDRNEDKPNFEKNGNTATDMFEVRIDGQSEPFVFDFNHKYKKLTINKIVRNITAISELLSEPREQ